MVGSCADDGCGHAEPKAGRVQAKDGEMTEGGPAKDRPPISSPGGVPGAVTVSQSSLDINASKPEKLQVDFLKDENSVKAFSKTLSSARFGRYLGSAKNIDVVAINIYLSNAKLSRSLYIGIQIWEVALRNRINEFLSWKYNNNWPFDETRALRSMVSNDKRRVKEALDRQNQKRGAGKVTTNHITADLSAGFWVSMLTKSYDVPFSWRYNLARVFPSDSSLERGEAALLCEGLLDLRNRIAHHEPIYHLPLEQRRADLGRLIAAMCPSHYAYLESACSFQAEWKAHTEISN